MSNPEDLFDSFDTVLRVDGGEFNLTIRELQLTGSGKTLESAYADLNRRKEELLKEHGDSGRSLDRLPAVQEARPERDARPVSGGLGLFAKKLLVVWVFIIAIIAFGAKKLNDTLSSSILALKEVQLVPSKPGRHLEEELYRSVDHPFSPEREKKIIESLRVLVQRHKPFVDEIKVLFEDEDKDEIKVLSVDDIKALLEERDSDAGESDGKPKKPTTNLD